jgi:hypothetical protein
MTERLTHAAVMRGGEIKSGFRSHYELRQSLGDTNPQSRQMGDVEGFMTSNGRFVNRFEAKDIAIEAKQISDGWRTAKRELLSSDINW